jgi:hypothetical protein
MFAWRTFSRQGCKKCLSLIKPCYFAGKTYSKTIINAYNGLATYNKLDGVIRLVIKLFSQVWYSHDITRMLQGWRREVATILLYRTCWNNLTSDIIRLVVTYNKSDNIDKVVPTVINKLFQTCWQLGTSSANTTCWRFVGRLATRCEIFAYVL